MGKAYFLSDMHLGAAYFPDSKDRERRVVSFLDSIKDDVTELYLLGDVLDYWYEYKYVVPRGFVRFFGKLAELSDAGVKITWLIGNHDIWIFDYIPNELGVKVVDGTYITDVLGTQMLMAHGDGIWQHSRKFKFLRALFRNRVCQHMFSAIHPRWTVAFANAWSRHSRRSALGSPTGERPEFHDACRKKALLHIDHMEEFSKDYAKSHPECKYYLFGHVHEVADRRISSDARMLVLGDWIERFTYAVFDGTTMRLCRFNPADGSSTVLP